MVTILMILVWAFYPESNQRTLEEMDLLFAAESPWSWAAEKKFKELKDENAHARGFVSSDDRKMDAVHVEGKKDIV